MSVANLEDQIAELRTVVLEIRDLLKAPQEQREYYRVEEVAEKMNRSPYSVREWCRFGRINASKHFEKRGGVEIWFISAQELQRLLDHGLLPIDPTRNREQRTNGQATASRFASRP